MFEEDVGEDDANEGGEARYPVLPSFLALQQMKNRLHLALLGKKLMKWTAESTDRELRRIVIDMNKSFNNFGDDFSTAFLMLARARYFSPSMNTLVLENVASEAACVVNIHPKSLAGVKVFEMQVIEEKFDPYHHLGLERGGRAISDAKKAWRNLVKLCVLMLQAKTEFTLLESANKSSHKQYNVLRRMMVPRIKRTIQYIIQTTEDKERDEIFRLKKALDVKQKHRRLIDQVTPLEDLNIDKEESLIMDIKNIENEHSKEDISAEEVPQTMEKLVDLSNKLFGLDTVANQCMSSMLPAYGDSHETISTIQLHCSHSDDVERGNLTTVCDNIKLPLSKDILLNEHDKNESDGELSTKDTEKHLSKEFIAEEVKLMAKENLKLEKHSTEPTTDKEICEGNQNGGEKHDVTIPNEAKSDKYNHLEELIIAAGKNMEEEYFNEIMIAQEMRSVMERNIYGELLKKVTTAQQITSIFEGNHNVGDKYYNEVIIIPAMKMSVKDLNEMAAQQKEKPVDERILNVEEEYLTEVILDEEIKPMVEILEEVVAVEVNVEEITNVDEEYTTNLKKIKQDIDQIIKDAVIMTQTVVTNEMKSIVREIVNVITEK